ncbi:DNA damage-regulated autophagy modulator protein 2 isoform X2 [Schistocerca serialis cubense]|uniref:DNA damage-regulated autophagy modulator protein 2 isoform X2 n=1 Tax=Schistocerca serialis cubense TaxID=2023355 RepID=UPI00214E8224|nr:DNA damage-regulated autophagy modulator protein 2 isoform X2 [Schistocerca serialis cubense]
MAFERLDVLPLAVFILFPATFLATYIIAVLLGHVEPDFPYISDTGTYSPESCIFGQLLNVGTLLLGLVIYVRYRQVAEYYSSYSLSPAVLSLNKMGVWFGLLSCLGLSFVANFQETNVITVHLTGAFLCFGFGTVYFWIHAVCSYHMQPLANSLQLAHLRLALAVICTVFFILLSITGVLSHIQFRGIISCQMIGSLLSAAKLVFYEILQPAKTLWPAKTQAATEKWRSWYFWNKFMVK